MQELENNNPGKAKVVDIGRSHEGRRMKGLIIKFAENLPIAMVESGRGSFSVCLMRDSANEPYNENGDPFSERRHPRA